MAREYSVVKGRTAGFLSGLVKVTENMHETVEIRRSLVIKDLICHVRAFEVLQSKNNTEVTEDFFLTS